MEEDVRIMLETFTGYHHEFFIHFTKQDESKSLYIYNMFK